MNNDMINDANEKCINCFFFKKKTQIERDSARSRKEAFLGLCRRYPHFESKNINDWCGEFLIKVV